MDVKPGTSAAAAAAKYNNYHSSEIETLARDELSMQVDCVSWNRRYCNLLAVGGYKLSEKDTALREGLLYLVIFDTSLPSGASIIQEEPMAGILDLKWETTENANLAIATSNCVSIFHLSLDKGGLFSLDRLYMYCLDTAKSSLMALYLEWVSQTEVIYSDSAGTVTLLGIIEKGENDDDEEQQNPNIKTEPGVEPQRPLILAAVEEATIHASIIWVVHFDKASKIIFTGADDGTFVAFHKSNFRAKPLWFVKRFPVGVTSINTIDDVIAVGSYDDLLRIYTFNITAAPERKVSLAYQTEINLEGAVWRTLWLPSLVEGEAEDWGSNRVDYKIAVAAARNGVHMLSLRRPSWTWNRHVSCLDYQGALAYGIDVKENVHEQSYTVATCYFDNHALHVWKTHAF